MELVVNPGHTIDTGEKKYGPGEKVPLEKKDAKRAIASGAASIVKADKKK